MDMKEKLVELQLKADLEDEVSENTTQHREYIADLMIANGVTVVDKFATTEQQWISVKDRLPENKSCILMYSADGGVAEGIYDNEQKRWVQFRWGIWDVRAVTHWMPLPQPPKGE